MVVGRRRARCGTGIRAVRRRLRGRADRHEAAARVFIDREPRPDRRRVWPDDPFPRLRHERARCPGPHRNALSLPQPRVLQEPAVPRHGLGAARNARAQSRALRWADPSHALGGVDRARGHRGDRRPASAERLCFGVAAAAGVLIQPGPAALLSQHASADRRGVDRAHRGPRRLRNGEVLRRRVPRPAARGQARRSSRRRALGASSPAATRRSLRRARAGACDGDRHARSDDQGAHRSRDGEPCRRLALSRTDRAAARQLQSSPVLPAHHDSRGARMVLGARLLPRPRASHGPLGLRLRPARRPHAGHRRRLRPARQADLRAVLSRRAFCADAVRLAAALSGAGRGPSVALALPTARARRRQAHLTRDGASARAHLGVSDVQLRDAAPAAVPGEMINLAGIAAQFAELVLAVLLAPLLTGWVNQCRAWLQNKSAPRLLQPYLNLNKLFQKEVVLARNASPLFRIAPYLIFGSLALAAAIVPTLDTDLPLNSAADAIALVGLLALARLFIALAGMDVGTAFGSLGARREMMVGFLAEPALLMVLFTASLISSSTSLSTIVQTLAHKEFGIYPSLAFAGVAFTMVSLAENARIPVDNPATHLELTMIHEAMVLEYSGRHLAMIEWAASLKLFVYSCIGLALFFPFGVATGGDALGIVLALPVLLFKLAIGGFLLALIETLSAKMRIFRAPEFLGTAFLLAVLGLLVHLLLEAGTRAPCHCMARSSTCWRRCCC